MSREDEYSENSVRIAIEQATFIAEPYLIVGSRFLRRKGVCGMEVNMSYEEEKDKIINEPPLTTDEGKWELYLYSLRHMAQDNLDDNRNSLTHLCMLKAFFYLCGEMIRENPNEKFGVIVMDIAQFKAVNDFCGRSEGDRLLKFIGACFEAYEKKRPYTYVGHVRADIFCLCTIYDEKQELVEIVTEIKNRIHTFPFPYRVLPSFGISTSMEAEPSISFLKDCATIALNSIKGKFFASYAFFDEEMRKELLREKQVENDIVEALEKEELAVYIQPKVNMRTGRIIGGEALIRWVHPDKGMIAPMEFVPVLEKNGFIIQIDEYVWNKVFQYLGGLKKDNRQLVPISINISRLHAYDDKLCDTLMSLKEKYQVPAAFVPLELTESAFLANEEGMYLRMKHLQEQGFTVSMDDFGTGYSTMNMLKNQPVDEIKIDRELIMDLDMVKSRIIMKHTIAMLKELEVKIMVEGVETEEQRQFLLEHNVDLAQGFFFYKPMPLEQFDALLAKQENEGV